MSTLTIGDRLKAERKSSGLTVAQLGIKACVHQSLIRSIESGSQTHPNEHALRRIATALNTPYSYLQSGKL